MPARPSAGTMVTKFVSQFPMTVQTVYYDKQWCQFLSVLWTELIIWMRYISLKATVLKTPPVPMFCTLPQGFYLGQQFNTLRPRQNGRHFADDIFKCIFLNENVWISIKISLKFVPKGRINNIPSLVQIMVWRRPGDKPLSEPMMVSLPTHICVTRPQWVNKC